MSKKALDETTRAPMRARKGRRFKQETRYAHNRSEGMTRRTNGGTRYQSGR